MTWLFGFKEPEGQVARWLEHQKQYDFGIKHRAGSQHSNADALSRRPCSEGSCRQCMSVVRRNSGPSRTLCPVTIFKSMWSPQEIQEAQSRDPAVSLCVQWKRNGRRPKHTEISQLSPAALSYWAQRDTLELRDGLLYRRWKSHTGERVVWQLVEPPESRAQTFRQLHSRPEGGHFGVNRTLQMIREWLYWLQYKHSLRALREPSHALV